MEATTQAKGLRGKGRDAGMSGPGDRRRAIRAWGKADVRKAGEAVTGKQVMGPDPGPGHGGWQGDTQEAGRTQSETALHSSQVPGRPSGAYANWCRIAGIS